MPITENEMSLETMKARLKSHVCGDCGSRLEIAWGGGQGYDGYILRCGNITHNTITARIKKSELRIEGEKIFRRLHGMDTTALMKMDKPTMLARIGQAKFPKDLTKTEQTLMCEVAISYGFDPIMQELMIYQGNPYVTINGRYRKAQETGQFDGMDSRPATESERKARNAKQGDFLYRCEVWRKDASHPFVGWGRVLEKETHGSEHLPIVKDPDRQAEKRAESMGLRKAFSMPFPIQGWEEAQMAMAEVNGRTVDTKTGEILEGEFKEITEEKKEESSEATELEAHDEEAKQKATPVPKEQKPQKELTLKDLQDALTLCNWSTNDADEVKALKGWKDIYYKDLKPDQIKELVDHINANPK